MQKEVYILRHAEKDPQGTLTEQGRAKAKELATRLPTFFEVISSDSSRTQETAEILTGIKPKVDPRAGFYMTSPEKSEALNKLAVKKDISFLEAVVEYNDAEVLQGIENKAAELNQLIDWLLENLPDGARALVLSHDLSISPALKQRGIPLESIDFLNGYIIDNQGNVSAFHP